MSEYWKSTPKYWCKHCSAYVKDTPFERKQHESTAKHQGNLKRFLRGVQNDHEKGERDKERAKAEVDRLNRITGGSASSTATGASSSNSTNTARKPAIATLTASDQKRQWAQLAEMGIQIPESARADMAMPGQWQTVSTTTGDLTTAEKSLSTGVRKRKLEDGREEEDEEAVAETVTRRGWGTTTRQYPGKDDADLDTLLSTSIIKKEVNIKTEPKIEPEQLPTEPTGSDVFTETNDATATPTQLETNDKATSETNVITADMPTVKSERDALVRQAALTDILQEIQPVFKKRKSKVTAGKELA